MLVRFAVVFVIFLASQVVPELHFDQSYSAETLYLEMIRWSPSERTIQLMNKCNVFNLIGWVELKLKMVDVDVIENFVRFSRSFYIALEVECFRACVN